MYGGKRCYVAVVVPLCVCFVHHATSNLTVFHCLQQQQQHSIMQQQQPPSGGFYWYVHAIFILPHSPCPHGARYGLLLPDVPEVVELHDDGLYCYDSDGTFSDATYEYGDDDDDDVTFGVTSSSSVGGSTSNDIDDFFQDA